MRRESRNRMEDVGLGEDMISEAFHEQKRLSSGIPVGPKLDEYKLWKASCSVGVDWQIFSQLIFSPTIVRSEIEIRQTQLLCVL